MSIKSFETKYGTRVLEPYKTVLINYLVSHKNYIFEDSGSPLESKIGMMIFNDFSINSPVRYLILPLEAHNQAQINAMHEERRRCRATGEHYSDAEWIKKHSDEYSREENALIAALFEKDKEFFLDVLKRAA